MNAIDFLKTVYFGDRYCTKLLLDSTNNKVELHINQISRIRDKSGEWNYIQMRMLKMVFSYLPA